MRVDHDFRQAFYETFVEPDEDSFVEPKTVYYDGPNGETIDGALFLAEERPAPAVTMIYSPILHIHDAYITYAQFLVKRGFSAFIPRHSLSSMEAAIDEFGAAGRWLKSRDDIDEDRVAVYGQSAGGHDVYFQLAKHPGLWSAGIVWAGVADMIPLLEWGHIPDHVLARLGDPYDNAEHWWDRSPITHFAAIEDPLLIMHGTNDEIVPTSQARLVYRELHRLGFEEGRDFEFEIYPGEPHGDLEEDGLYRKWNRIDEFLHDRVKQT